jgi:uncharacterized delta-60 repeat protein
MSNLQSSLLLIGLGLGTSLVSLVACGGSGDGGDGDGDGDRSTGGTSTGDGDGDHFGGGGSAGDGDEDLVLGVPGAVATYLEGFPEALALQEDKLLIAGRITSDFWVTRTHGDGTVDESFGEAGKSEIAFPEATLGASGVTADFDVAYGLHVDENDIFVVGAIQGYLGPFETRWGMAKLDRDGALDTSFADDGIKVIDWTIASRLYQARTDAEGQIYVAGTIDNASSDIALVRLAENGDVDNSFSLTGSGAGAVLSDNNFEDGICLLVGDERVIAGGGPEFGLAAVDLSGAYDTGFGDNGWSKPARGLVYAVHELSDGTLYAVGTESANEDSRVEALLVVRLLPTGELDESFAEGGIARLTYDFGSYLWPDLEEQVEWQDAFARVNGLSVLSDGSLLIYADAVGFLARYPVLLKVTPEGELDPEFGQNGLVAFPLIIPLLAGAVSQPASRLASDGNTAWFADQYVFDSGNRGVLVTVDLNAL